MDPRVSISAAGLQKKFEAETRLASLLDESLQALLQGASIRDQLEKLKEQPNSAIGDAVQAAEKKISGSLGAPGGFFAPPSEEITLARVNGQAGALYQQVWYADEPTVPQMEGLAGAERGGADVLKRWNEFKNSDLPALNQRLRESKAPEVLLEPDPHREEPEEDEE
jgi:hypothetical protein